MIIAIDGPAASGKSSTAAWVAARLGFLHIDSGALYRAATLAARSSARQPSEWTAESVLAASEGITLVPEDAVFTPARGGVPFGEEIRGTEVTRHVSRVASMAAVRDWVNDRVRDAAQGHDVVVDGRDIGTVVFPDADLKIFLTASPEARAGRRISQRGAAVQPEDLDAEAAALAARDHADSTRAVAPLRPAPDAVHLDTTSMGFSEQVAFIVGRARPLFSQP